MIKSVIILVTIASVVHAWSSPYDGDNPFERAGHLKKRVLDNKEFKPYYLMVTFVQEQLKSANELEFTLILPQGCLLDKGEWKCIHRGCLLGLLKLRDAGYRVQINTDKLTVVDQHKMLCGSEQPKVTISTHDYLSDLSQWKKDAEKDGNPIQYFRPLTAPARDREFDDFGK